MPDLASLSRRPAGDKYTCNQRATATTRCLVLPSFHTSALSRLLIRHFRTSIKSCSGKVSSSHNVQPATCFLPFPSHLCSLSLSRLLRHFGSSVRSRPGKVRSSNNVQPAITTRCLALSFFHIFPLSPSSSPLWNINQISPLESQHQPQC